MTRVHHVLLDASAEEALGREGREAGQPHPEPHPRFKTRGVSLSALACGLRLKAEGQRAAAPKPLAITYLSRPDKVGRRVHLQGYSLKNPSTCCLNTAAGAGGGRLPPTSTHRPRFLPPGETDLRLLASQEKGQMGLDGTKAEPWAQHRREGKQEGTTEGYTQAALRGGDTLALRSKAAGHVC